MGAYSNRVIADGASYYWRLGESSGLTAVASVGGANGTISGGVTLGQPGAIADGTTAMLFNGTTGQVATPTLTIPVTATLEAWVKYVNDGTIQPILTLGSSERPTWHILASGQVEFYDNLPNLTFGSASLLPAGVWQHVVCVLTGTTASMYLNGVLDGSGSYARPSPSTAVGYLGADPAFGAAPNGFFNGALDDIAMYPRALTAAEVAAHYAVGRTTEVGAQGPYADRVISDGASNYWRLNESSGTTAVDSVGAKDGTISGGVTLSQPSPLQDGTSAMLFNGTTGKIVTAVVAIPAAWTFEAWIKTTVAGVFPSSQLICGTSLTGAQNGNWYSFYLNAGALGLQINHFPSGASGSNSALVISDGAWHHMAWVFSGTTRIDLYIDGVVRSLNSNTASAPHSATTSAMDVGWSDGWPSFFNGGLDEVALYPRALSASEIAAHYQVSSVPEPRDLNTGLYTYLLGIFGLSAATSYAERVKADGATNHWRLGETSGTTAVDAIGGANGTISGGVTLNQPSALADGNGAMAFNGSTGKVLTTAPVTIPLIATLEVWFKFLANTADDPLVSNRGGTGDVVYFGTTGLNNAFLDVISSGFAQGAIAVTAGWHHAAYVLNGSTVTFYLDGVVDGAPKAFVRTTPGVGPLAIGNDGGDFFPGSLDDVSIYPRALTANEIAAHYSLGRSAMSGGNDLTTLITRYLATLTGDMTARWKQMEKNAGF